MARSDLDLDKLLEECILSGQVSSRQLAQMMRGDPKFAAWLGARRAKDLPYYGRLPSFACLPANVGRLLSGTLQCTLGLAGDAFRGLRSASPTAWHPSSRRPAAGALRALGRIPANEVCQLCSTDVETIDNVPAGGD